MTDSSAATASPRRASHRFDNGLRYRDAEHPDNTQFTPARSDRVYLDGDQALFAGLVRMEFGPAARIVMFDGDDGRLYAEVEASHAGYVSDFRVVTEADRG